MRCALYKYVRPPNIASAIFPKTSTRTGPKVLDILSSDLRKMVSHNYKGTHFGGRDHPYPQSIYSIHITTSPLLFMKAPKKETMYGELHSCMIPSSLTMRLRMSGVASTCMIWHDCELVAVLIPYKCDRPSVP